MIHLFQNYTRTEKREFLEKREKLRKDMEKEWKNEVVSMAAWQVKP